MAKEKKYSDIDLSKYDSGYQKSDDVIKADNKKTEAESAVDKYEDFKTSDAYNAANQNKVNAEDAIKNYGDFAYSNQATFDDIINKILNREKFTYDLNGDALYQQYKDKYIKQGKMAMQDTMGQAAAMTGGYGNSYAASVGNQAYQASLENLNDVIPELYQLAFDKYNQEGQDLYNQYGMLSDDRNMEYGMWGDKRNALVADRDYYGNEANNQWNKDYGMWSDKRNQLVADRDYYANEANNAYAKDYGEWSDNRTYDQNQYWSETEFGYGQERDRIADEQWQKSFDEGVRQFNANLAETQRQHNENMALSREKMTQSGGSGGGGSGDSGGGFDTSGILTYAGLDDNGRAVYYDENGKSRTYEVGINPYTGTKNKDAKHGTFSNGYQPNNIGGTKLKNSGMSTNVTGKDQTIWECNGKYWVWYGKQNKYVEVDIDD